MQKYIVVFKEKEVKGYDDLSQLQEGILFYNGQERREKAENRGLQLENMTEEEAEALDLEPGDEPKIYETADVVEMLKNSDLDSSEIGNLEEKLQEDEVCFKIDDFVMGDLLDDVDQFYRY